jgi:hypothetical protein
MDSRTRTFVLACALAFIALLGGLTLWVLVRKGPDILTLVSLLVLAMLGSGVVGALRHPPHR